MKKWMIGICDDSESEYEKSKNIMERYMKETEDAAEIFYFPDKESLLKNEKKLDILFMDIKFSGKAETGIQFVHNFDRKQKECQIVYLTNYLFYAVDVYETEHSYFVLKEQFQERIGQVFEKIRHNLNQSIKKLAFSVINGGQIFLKPEEILYFERNLRKTRIITETQNYEIWNKLGEIEDMLLKPDFLRCHNSYIVNLLNVKEMHTQKFIMKNDMEIMISREYRKKAKDMFMNWACMQRV